MLFSVVHTSGSGSAARQEELIYTEDNLSNSPGPLPLISVSPPLRREDKSQQTLPSILNTNTLEILFCMNVQNCQPGVDNAESVNDNPHVFQGKEVSTKSSHGPSPRLETALTLRHKAEERSRFHGLYH